MPCTNHHGIIHFSLHYFRILAVQILKQNFPFPSLLEISRFPEVDYFGAVSNMLVQIERCRVNMEIFHDPLMVHKRWVFSGDWEIRETHHLLACVDNSRSVHRAMAFLLGKIPQPPDGVFLLKTHRLKSIVFAAFYASKATSSSTDYRYSHFENGIKLDRLSDCEVKQNNRVSFHYIPRRCVTIAKSMAQFAW